MSQRSLSPGSDREEPQKSAPGTILRIAPNCSLSPYQAKIFLIIMGISLFLVSGAAALAGYWLVLPFAGLELIVLIVAIKLTMRRGRYQEVLRISDDKIIVEKGELQPQERVEFPRYWATTRLVHSMVKSYPSKLLLACKGRSLEIGACLTESERLGLETRLKMLLGPVESLPPLSTP